MKKTGHRISHVTEGSIAWEMGVEPGMFLVSINGQEVEDSFDYTYMMADSSLSVLIREENGEETLLEVEKEEDEDFGLEFESPLMNGYRSCSNRCIFCFIDQMPKGMRETLYFKDDDSRLSFLQGNYVTLTNMTDHDIERIIRYRMEPINISIQTTNPELRVRMLRNRFAGEALKKIQVLKDAGIAMNGQIVLCRGWNDGPELDRTIRDLTAYLPQMQSVSVVPVGLSRFRDGLEKLEPFTPEEAGQVIDQIERWQRIVWERLSADWQEQDDRDDGIEEAALPCGEEASDFEKAVPPDEEALMRGAPRHFIHASDEWYILAGRELPEEERYDGYIQYENGVGMLRLLMTETAAAIKEYRGKLNEGSFRLPERRHVTSICGLLAAPYIRRLAAEVESAFPGCTLEVLPIRNDFFGERITVTGLLTGQDIIARVRELRAEGFDLGEELLLPVNTLRRGEHVFLDDLTTEDLADAAGIPVRIVGEGGDEFVRAQIGLAGTDKEEDRQYYE